MACFVDMDGVLFDFMGAALERHGRSDVMENYPKGQWAIEDHLGITPAQFWQVLEGHDFWAALKPYRWMLDVLEIVTFHFAHDWWIASSPCLDHGSASGKVESLQRHMPKIEGKTFDRYFLGKYKYHLAKPGAVLIDDNEENCRLFEEAGGKAILFPAPWNRFGRFSDDPVRYIDMCLV